MPPSGETRTRSTNAITTANATTRESQAFLSAFMKEQGLEATYKLLKQGRLSTDDEMMTVIDGVVQRSPTGRYNAALQTNQGPVVLQGAERTDRRSTDPQMISSRSSRSIDSTVDSIELTVDQILCQLTDASANPPASLICMVELTRFDPSQNQTLLPLLWQYILDHRDSNNCGELVAVASAIRKYIAIMPMDRMGELAVLLETGHRSQLPIDLEIEVAKMIYRNFEVYPPTAVDPHPELAQRFWERVQAYINPLVLLKDKHSAITSLAIEAIVAMRSPLAEQALQTAAKCPYRWFAELVNDDLEELQRKWSSKNPSAENWLRELQNNIFADVLSSKPGV